MGVRSDAAGIIVRRAGDEAGAKDAPESWFAGTYNPAGMSINPDLPVASSLGGHDTRVGAGALALHQGSLRLADLVGPDPEEL